MNVVQLKNPRGARRAAAVDGRTLHVFRDYPSAYALALSAIERREKLSVLIASAAIESELGYDAVYDGDSEWKLLPAFDHPDEPGRCLVCGTGLTHLQSAQNRQNMHAGAKEETDSMKMYRWGLDGGRPRSGSIGVQPEWFYKGTGRILRAHGEALTVPAFGESGGEEAEVAAAYVIDGTGTPRRVGFMTANEFSDHVMEARNYLYLAPSKLRECAIGPELVVDGDFSSLSGKVQIDRDGAVLWNAELKTGDANMSHTLENLEHHHFKYAAHRDPGDVHIYFFGAGAFSSGAGIRLQHGDEMSIEFSGWGRALKNKVAVSERSDRLCRAVPL
ncbi:MAG TPA: AraD1 family protein [Planctomycetota bacterium]|nr:AraD1 family protein [Planctomycetota bacterium]